MPGSRRRCQPLPRGGGADRRGLYGVERGLELPEPCARNAYEAAGVERLPATLAEAAAAFGAPATARQAFGDNVVAHYLNNARVELAAFNAAVTDWERRVGLNAFKSDRPARPVVGLTACQEQVQTGIWDIAAGYLEAEYIEGVAMAGGIVVLLPPQPVGPEIAGRLLDSLDALVITGGPDVDPAAYGQEPHPATDQPRADRDAWEFALLRGALDRGLPVLGVCRGAQVLNVAFGGTLHQHLPDVLGHSGHQAGNGVFTRLPVGTVAGTRLAALIGESVEGACYHHQAIDKVGDPLVVSAMDADGVVEALELPGESFVLAVQWHPEKSLDDLRLFAAVVEAARAHADRWPPPN